MFDTLGGAGAGAGEALTELLARQFQEQLLTRQQQEVERRNQEVQRLAQQELSQRQQSDEADRALRAQGLEQQATAERGRRNVEGLEEMHRQAALQAPPPPPKRTVVTTIGKRGQPMKQAFTDDELAGGVDEYREPNAPPKPERDPIADYRARKVIDAEFAGSQTSTAEAQDTAREAQRIATALRNHKGLPGAFGVYDSQLPTFRQSTADAEELLKSLQGLLTLENTGKLKGVLSNADMLILRQASTTLSSRISEDAARTELDRIAKVMGKVGGGGGGLKVRMRAPTGEIEEVEPEKVEFYKSRGATVVGG